MIMLNVATMSMTTYPINLCGTCQIQGGGSNSVKLKRKIGFKREKSVMYLFQMLINH